MKLLLTLFLLFCPALNAGGEASSATLLKKLEIREVYDLREAIKNDKVSPEQFVERIKKKPSLLNEIYNDTPLFFYPAYQKKWDKMNAMVEYLREDDKCNTLRTTKEGNSLLHILAQIVAPIDIIIKWTLIFKSSNTMKPLNDDQDSVSKLLIKYSDDPTRIKTFYEASPFHSPGEIVVFSDNIIAQAEKYKKMNVVKMMEHSNDEAKKREEEKNEFIKFTWSDEVSTERLVRKIEKTPFLLSIPNYGSPLLFIPANNKKWPKVIAILDYLEKEGKQKILERTDEKGNNLLHILVLNNAPTKVIKKCLKINSDLLLGINKDGKNPPETLKEGYNNSEIFKLLVARAVRKNYNLRERKEDTSNKKRDTRQR